MKAQNAPDHGSCKDNCFSLLVDRITKILLAMFPASFHSSATFLRGLSVRTKRDVVSKKNTTEALPLV